MRHPSRLIERAVFGAAVLASLGFGATQALAESSRATARACEPYAGYCHAYCVGNGYGGGSCVPNGHGGTKCFCY